MKGLGENVWTLLLLRLFQFEKYMLLLGGGGLYFVGTWRNLMGTSKDAIAYIGMFVWKIAVSTGGTCIWLWKLQMRSLVGLAVLWIARLVLPCVFGFTMSAARLSLNIQCPGVLSWSTIYVVVGPFECKPTVVWNTTRRRANTFGLVDFLEAAASLRFCICISQIAL